MITTYEPSKLRLPFDGADRIGRTFSQAGQDLFVLSALNGKRNGVFLDLGCNQPIKINNTFLLESEFEWNGLSVDIDPGFFELYVFRKCKTLIADCTRLDWDLVIEQLGTSTIDYLSLDLDPPNVTLECLERIPFDRVRFSVITFEHDAYRSGDAVREPSRRIFEANGYQRVCSDVRIHGAVFEDWYCDPDVVGPETIEKLKSRDKEWDEVLFATEGEI